MRIETTVHMHRLVLEQLVLASRKTRMSTNRLVLQLLQHSMKIHTGKMVMASAVRYQKRADKNMWHNLHIIVNEYEYEYFLDMRKFFKVSVSLLIASLIKKYLPIIIHKLLRKKINADNYSFQNYVVIHEYIQGTACWKLYWGMPQKIPFPHIKNAEN